MWQQFVENPTKKQIPEETKNNIDILLLEKIPLVGIARITGVSRPGYGCATLRDRKYVNKKYAETPREIKVSGKPKRKLTIECDEM